MGKQKLQSISTFLYNIEIASHVKKLPWPEWIYLVSWVTIIWVSVNFGVRIRVGIDVSVMLRVSNLLGSD